MAGSTCEPSCHSLNEVTVMNGAPGVDGGAPRGVVGGRLATVSGAGFPGPHQAAEGQRVHRNSRALPRE